MSTEYDWVRFGELIVPGLVVGVLMLAAQYWSNIQQHKAELVNEERWRSKSDAFTLAVELVDRDYSSRTWSGPDPISKHVPTGTPVPTLEINSVYARLMLVAENPQIPTKFYKFFDKQHSSSPASRGEFLILLREELFGEKISISAEEVPWIY